MTDFELGLLQGFVWGHLACIVEVCGLIAIACIVGGNQPK